MMLKRISFTLLLCSLLLTGCAHPPPKMIAKLVNFQPTVPVKEVWQNNAGDGIADQYLTLTPVAANGKIFTASYSGKLVAVDALSGQRVWHINTNAPLTSGLAADQHLIFEDRKSTRLNSSH